MIELGTGWDKVDDPRDIVTWPLTPGERYELEGNYHFSAKDMIEHQDNVYAEAKKPDRKYEVAVQGDSGQQEFMNQLNRKQGALLADKFEDSDDDEVKKRKGKGKRRGRKSKY